MIAPHESTIGGDLLAFGVELNRLMLLSVFAEFHVRWGAVEWWKLTKPVGCYGPGDLITRERLERAVFGASYGMTQVQGKPADFAAVESPGKDSA